MESADESGRAAANAILSNAGSSFPPAQIYERYSAPELADLKQLDAERWRHGRPHLLNTPWPTDNPNSFLSQLAQLTNGRLRARP
jgi:hypothetical protein